MGRPDRAPGGEQQPDCACYGCFACSSVTAAVEYDTDASLSLFLSVVTAQFKLEHLERMNVQELVGETPEDGTIFRVSSLPYWEGGLANLGSYLPICLSTFLPACYLPYLSPTQCTFDH